MRLVKKEQKEQLNRNPELRNIQKKESAKDRTWEMITKKGPEAMTSSEGRYRLKNGDIIFFTTPDLKDTIPEQLLRLEGYETSQEVAVKEFFAFQKDNKIEAGFAEIAAGDTESPRWYIIKKKKNEKDVDNVDNKEIKLEEVQNKLAGIKEIEEVKVSEEKTETSNHQQAGYWDNLKKVDPKKDPHYQVQEQIMKAREEQKKKNIGF